MQWLTWAYVDLRAAESAEYEVALETVITPFGAGHLLMYAILVGAGVAWLGWAIRRSPLSHRLVAPADTIVGAATALTAAGSLLLGLEGGGDGHWLFNVATLCLPLCYLWAAALALDVSRGT